MPLFRPRALSAVLALALFCPAAASQADGTEPLRAIVDRVVGPVAERQALPGVIVGVSWRGRRSFFAYSGTGAAPMNADTIVEIGSITKTFTTALFAEALAEGRMRKDAPIQSYMRLRLQPCAARVTPLQLADFTSGMPILPGDLPRELRDRGIEHYTREDFFRWIARWRPREGDGCDLPAPYLYSNASVGLLGYLVADRLGAPWADLVRDRITGPLHMSSTSLRVADADRDRLARGHRPDGEAAMPWPVFAWFAAGALRSSASDMLSFGEAALGHETIDGRPTPPALIAALREAMAPIYQPENETFEVGMTWVTSPGDADRGTRPIAWKAGGTDGFNSVIVINPGKDLAIFIAADKAVNDIPNIGVKLSRSVR